MEGKETVRLINMKDVKVEEVKWLLYPFIPYGKITILQGDPGEGKTTVMLHIMASLTRGENPLPAEEKKGGLSEPVSVIYQTAEDGLGDTIKPRLLSAGADCSRVLVIDESEKALTVEDNRLEAAIKMTGAKLVVLDPLQGYLGAGVDMHRANEIRPLMNRLARLAEKFGCAIVLIGHMNKNGAGKAGYRGLGSIDITAAARSVILCGRIRDDPQVRVLCQTKSSLAPEAAPIAFCLDRKKGFRWMGEYEITADELLAGGGKGSKLKDAMDFLEKFLSSGSRPSTEVSEAATARGISKATLRNASDRLGVERRKIGNQWWCDLKRQKEDAKMLLS